MTHRNAQRPRPNAAGYRRNAIGLAVASLFLAGAALPAQAQSADTPAATTASVRDYNIPAGPLSPALSRFAGLAGVTLSTDAALTEGLSTQGMRGRYGIADGFTQLLRGSGLRAVTLGGGVYRLERLPAGTREATLAPMTVTASGLNDGTTEGTRRYTQTGPNRSATGLGLTLRETPQSVSVITRQQMNDQAVQSVQEILHNAPGITVTQLDSERYTFYSRGFGIDHFQYDGVPTQFTNNYAAGESEVDPVIYDRVEIVRGATGLLTGAGDPSAAINLVRKRADSKVFTGTLTAGAASWDNYRASADLSLPLTQDGRIRARLVAAEEDKESHVDGYSRERRTLYGALAVDLTSATTLHTGISYQHGRAKGVTYGGFPLVHSDGTAIDWRGLGRSFSIWPRWSSEQTDSTNAFAELAHEWNNGWKTTMLAMYSKQEVDNARLFAWGFPAPDSGLMSSNPSRVKFPGERKQRSLDIRNTGTFEALGRSHEAVLGLSHSRQKFGADRIGATGAAPAIGLFDWSNYPEPTGWGSAVASETWDRRQTGGYGALRLTLTEPLKLIVGGRFNHWERSGAGYMGRNPYDFEHRKFTPYAGMIYDFGHHYSLYGSYTSIYNPQNYRDRNGSFLEPAEGNNWEAGIKGEFLDGRVQASLALFRIEQDNVAKADAGHLVPGTTAQAYVGARGVTSKGIEIELNGELRPGWNLAFNAAHFKAIDANGEDVSTASPRTALRLFTTYRLPGDWQRLTVGGGINWQSKVTNPTGVYHYDNPNGVGSYRQNACLLANLMARYQFTPQLSLQFNVDNLLDKWYYTSVNFNEQVMWGTPRSYRATLEYKF